MYQPQQPPQPRLINHENHPQHPLKEVYKNSKFECKSCRTAGQGTRFQCHPCKFDIHPTCTSYPSSITSFTHPQHPLQLMQKPHLSHKCNLCRKAVKGMVFRCKGCDFLLHPNCSLLPEWVSNQPMHPSHPLRLMQMAKSECDICEKSCENWRYYCGVCEVHIHVGCLSGKKKKSSSDQEEDGEFADVFGELIGGGVAALFGS